MWHVILHVFVVIRVGKSSRLNRMTLAPSRLNRKPQTAKKLTQTDFRKN